MKEDRLIKRILLVDDDPGWLSYLSDLLYHPTYPYIIRTATNGEEALRRLCEVDLVITDIQMPLMDGFTLVKRIKEVRPDLPVIMQSSGYAEEEINQVISKKLGLEGFVLKHETDKLLWPLVVSVLGNGRCYEEGKNPGSERSTHSDPGNRDRGQ